MIEFALVVWLAGACAIAAGVIIANPGEWREALSKEMLLSYALWPVSAFAASVAFAAV